MQILRTIGRGIRLLSTLKNELLSNQNNSVFDQHLKCNKQEFSAKDNSKLLHYFTARNIIKLDLHKELEISRQMFKNPYCLNNLHFTYIPKPLRNRITLTLLFVKLDKTMKFIIHTAFPCCNVL